MFQKEEADRKVLMATKQTDSNGLESNIGFLYVEDDPSSKDDLDIILDDYKRFIISKLCLAKLHT